MLSAPDLFDPRDTALFLDVDGTLLEIQAHPDQVVASDHLKSLLLKLDKAVDGALALVSGRSVSSLDRIFAPHQFVCAGSHGTELRLPGNRQTQSANQALSSSLRSRLEQYTAARRGLLLEPKPGGASLHYRQAPHLEAQCRQFMVALVHEAGADFRLIEGKKVLEIAPRAHNKGAAIRQLMRLTPFAGRAPVFVGDDVTDEDGFQVVNACNGTAIRVGDTVLPSAKFRLQGVSQVLDWLAQSVD